MHEYSLVLSLIERVEQEMRSHNAVAARCIKISVGELSGVEADLLSYAFEIAREDTLLRTAQLEVTSVVARWQCAGCARDVDSQKGLICDSCGNPAHLVEGGEILFESVELELPSD
jgi:hydrogenase nickel incorporation protein HypA/HybF